GTYPLPEAQLDRFMFMIRVSYPTEAEELEVLRRTTTRAKQDVEPVVSAEEVLAMQDVVRDVPVAEHVARYALRLVRSTRRPKRGEEDQRPEFAQQYLNWGAGPRASQNLILAGKARALLQGRTHVMAEDIDAIAGPVMRHRLIPNFAAEAEGVTADDIVDKLVDIIDVAEPSDPQAAAVLR
ncbi:MAG: MoxR family ATPase, partial [Planctomycetota bacterium]